jgi:hypothetical protein
MTNPCPEERTLRAPTQRERPRPRKQAILAAARHARNFTIPPGIGDVHGAGAAPPHCSMGRSLATHTAKPSLGTGSMPASRNVSRTKRWRSLSAKSGTSVTAANSEANWALFPPAGIPASSTPAGSRGCPPAPPGRRRAERPHDRRTAAAAQCRGPFRARPWGAPVGECWTRWHPTSAALSPTRRNAWRTGLVEPALQVGEGSNGSSACGCSRRTR